MSCKDNNHISLSSDLTRLLFDTDTMDIVLMCQAQEIRVHRLILCARSPVFRAMLQSEMQENINGVINVKDVNAEALKEMIHYMYTGNVDWNKVKNLERELLVLADKYQVQGLVHNCSSKLASSLNKDNALEIGILGEMYNSDVLIQKCAKFISSNTNKCLVRDWMEKIQKSPRLMANLIKNMKDSKDTQNSRRNYENLYDHSFFRLMEDQAQYNQNI